MIMEEDDGTNTLTHDTFSGTTDHDDHDDFDDVHDLTILEKAYEPLYEGSQTTLLFVVLLLVNLTVMNGLSNIAISWMLRLLSEFLLPPSNILPHSYQDLFTIMKDIGMEYQAIDACPNDHIIYHKQHEFATACLECHINRYQIDQLTKKVPHKVVHYILIIPRMQRLFRCESLVQFMDYHARNRSRDDILQTPTNGFEFRDMEEK